MAGARTDLDYVYKRGCRTNAFDTRSGRLYVRPSLILLFLSLVSSPYCSPISRLPVFYLLSSRLSSPRPPTPSQRPPLQPSFSVPRGTCPRAYTSLPPPSITLSLLVFIHFALTASDTRITVKFASFISSYAVSDSSTAFTRYRFLPNIFSITCPEISCIFYTYVLSL